MLRLVLLLSLVPFLLPGSLFAQVDGDEGARTELWLGGTGGFGSGGLAGRASGVFSVSDWALTVRYAKTMAGGSRREVYREDAGLLVGRMVRLPSGQGSVSLGAGRVSVWDENYVSCPDCGFWDSRHVGGTRTDNYGALVEATIFPGADGGSFVWGLTLFGAFSQTGRHVSAGITLGLGRTP